MNGLILHSDGKRFTRAYLNDHDITDAVLSVSFYQDGDGKSHVQRVSVDLVLEALVVDGPTGGDQE